jgi:hypothetical protein
MRRGFLISYLLLPVATCAALGAAPAAADSMRCGKWVVSEATTKDELLKKCGEPQSREVSSEDVWALNPAGARVKTEAVTVTERWIYRPTPGTLPMQVVIIDDKVVSLQRAD